MNEEQINSLIEQLRAAGLEDEDIMRVFYEAFEKGKMDRKDLETLANVMGYELTDDFKNDPTPDPIASEGAEGMSEEDLENARTLEESGETPEEFKEDMEEKADANDFGGDDDGEDDTDDTEADDGEPDDTGDDTEDAADDTEDGEDEDADWNKAQKMFKL